MENSRQSTFELITGPSAGYYFFKDEIVERVRATRGNEYDFVYLLPVKRAVRRFKEMLMDALPARALIDPPVYTFYEFMLKVHRAQPKAAKIISPAMQLFLIEEVLRKNVKKLRFFSAENVERRGLVRKVDQLITELREYGYSPEELLENGDVVEDQRLDDFALLLKEFDATLTNQGLLDEAGAIQQLSLLMNGNAWRKAMPELRAVYLNGYGLFTKPMLNTIEHLQTVCDVKIKMDYFEGQPLLFEHLQRAHFDLTSLNPLRIEHATPHPWEEVLFQRKSVENPLSVPDKNILIQPTRSKREEVAFVAAYARRLHHHKSIPLSNIGITFPSLEEYAPLIHEIFPEYGLPYNLSTGYNLSQSPLIRSFLLLLEIPLQRFDVKKVVQLLGSPFYKTLNPEGILDTDLLKTMAVEMRLTHLHGSWEDKIQHRIDYLENLDAEDDDSFALELMRRKVERYKSALSELKSLLELFKPLEGKHDVTSFRETFLELMDTLGFLNWYKGDSSDVLSLPEQEREYRAFNRFSKLLDQFSWIVTNLQKSAPKKGGQLSLKELHQYLTLLISDATYNTREWSNYGVQVMPRLEILAMEPQVLIFGGMVENRFPRPFTHDVFFNDEKRESLGLAATEDLLAQDRYMFYQMLGAPAERLIFTWPQFERESARVPSNFLNILAERLQVRIREKVPSQNFLRSPGRLLERVAEHIPPGLDEADEKALRIWRELVKQKPIGKSGEANEAAQLWLEKVDVNHRKRRREVFSDYEGMLDKHPDVTAQLEKEFGDRAFSVTRLESYAFCPIQFFFRYIMKLEEEREPESGMTALERGQLVHNTFFRFYSTLRETSPELLKTPWEARDLLFEIAGEEFDKLPFSGLLFEIERERYFGVDGRPGLWDVFLQQERDQIERLHFYPAFFEVGFGETGLKKEQDPISLEEPIELEKDGKTLKLIGKVDRIDISADNKQAMLLDYKTGFSAISPKNVRDGMSLQLPIYAVVLPKLLEKAGKHKEAKAVMNAIYQVRDVDNCERKPVMFNKEAVTDLSPRLHAALPNGYVKDEYDEQLSFEDLLERSKHKVFDYLDRIRSGNFRHTRFPKEAACETHCEFKRMCRKNVRKLLH